MFRIRLSVDVQEGIGYQNRDLSLELFSRLAQGERIVADIAAHDVWPRYPIVYYTALWDPNTRTWAESIGPDQIQQAYQDWSRDNFA